VKLLLGIAYQEDEQEEEAFKVFEEAAAQGSVSALYQKAAYLYDGRGVEKNTKVAIDLIEEVIELAHKGSGKFVIDYDFVNIVFRQ
jgi:TPR repeat protein